MMRELQSFDFVSFFDALSDETVIVDSGGTIRARIMSEAITSISAKSPRMHRELKPR